MAEKTIPETRQSVEAETAETRERGRYLVPPVDIYETEHELVVVADMPGVAKEDVNVHVDDGILTLEGRSKHALEGEPRFREYTLQNFYRQFQLGEQIDQEKINASLKNGVLTIALPKAEKAKPKQIAVTVA
ncbi:Hsp20/alpha crystallin family protein [bacterium]|nr:Hsp20/alpha crystallin family protein [bacterium]